MSEAHPRRFPHRPRAARILLVIAMPIVCAVLSRRPMAASMPGPTHAIIVPVLPDSAEVDTIVVDTSEFAPPDTTESGR
jgi:hypothetical protein